MNITLKNIKHSAFASQETNCFEATIYVDGVKAGNVRNDGNGGCDLIWPHDLAERIEAYAKTLPPVDTSEFHNDGQKHTRPQSAEGVIGALLDKWLTDRANRRLCSRLTCFRKPGETYNPGEYHTLKTKFTPEAKAFLVKKYGVGVFILNEQVTA